MLNRLIGYALYWLKRGLDIGAIFARMIAKFVGVSTDLIHQGLNIAIEATYVSNRIFELPDVAIRDMFQQPPDVDLFTTDANIIFDNEGRDVIRNVRVNIPPNATLREIQREIERLAEEMKVEGSPELMSFERRAYRYDILAIIPLFPM